MDDDVDGETIPFVNKDTFEEDVECSTMDRSASDSPVQPSISMGHDLTQEQQDQMEMDIWRKVMKATQESSSQSTPLKGLKCDTESLQKGNFMVTDDPDNNDDSCIQDESITSSQNESPTHLTPASAASTSDRRESVSPRPRRESGSWRDPIPTFTTTQSHRRPDRTFIDYLYTELTRGYDLEKDEQRFIERREKFYIFLRIPLNLERFIWYGFFQCMDAFLFVFTLLPIRFMMALYFLTRRWCKKTFSDARSFNSNTPLLMPAELCDLLKGCILLTAGWLMNRVDMSMLYHIIKSQSVIKLYIFFNMLEVADKLFSSFGQDILDTLYWTANEPKERKREHLGMFAHLVVSCLYVFGHTVLVLLQATTLNVAINSKNKALLTIMLSNNFVELKSMVFKKFEKNNLFHMSCSDVRERFHYLMLLVIVTIMTMKEYNWIESHWSILLTDAFFIMIAEIIVDWLKHAFVTKFNEISPQIYAEYRTSLAYDMTSTKLKGAFIDHSDLVSRRMGFTPLPLAVLFYRVMTGSFPLIVQPDLYDAGNILLVWMCLWSFKCFINITLLGISCDLVDKHLIALGRKTLQARSCSSLPSSRHGSMEDLVRGNNCPNSQSTPHSPVPSKSASLADISHQAAIIHENYEKSMILSDSQVSLLSLDMEARDKVHSSMNRSQDDGVSMRKRKSILKPKASSLLRRVSLQETTSTSLQDDVFNPSFHHQ